MAKKKIISFSLWGDKAQYVGEGAIRQVETQPEYFPGWTCRFYYDASVPVEYIDALREYDCELVEKQPMPIGSGLYWRFEPAWDDPEVERFLVRDTDSAFSDRGSACVLEWEQSGKAWHVIRDNRSHETSMLGGLWGMVVGALPDFKTRMCMWFQQFVPDSLDPRSAFYGSDQTFLTRYIWPIARHDCLQHDEIFEQFGETVPFPKPMNEGHYCGMVWDNRYKLRRSPSCATPKSI